jgi:hypothetical protein
LKYFNKTRIVSDKLIAFLSSKGFYLFIFCFFLTESIWIALSALYPQAFDENFHFGLIKVYSHYWLPFLSRQPPNANAYGAVARDPSYLYHYLMSFPYRLIALFVHSQVWQVISMRLIDVGLFSLGIIIFRKVLEKVGISKSLTNVSIFIFILIPIVPQLAAQVSYDDLLFPLTGLVCLLTFDLIDQIKLRKPSASSILKLLIVCLLTSIVKYAFLPIFLGIILFIFIYIYRVYRHQLKQFLTDLKMDYAALNHYSKIGLTVLFIISVGLVFQRDGVNLVDYNSIEPDCSKVLSVNDCSSYSPWYYNYQNHSYVLNGSQSAGDNILIYTQQWFYYMWYRLFFAINGLNSNFANNPPLPLPSIAAAILALIGLIAVIKARQKLFSHNPYLVLMLVISVIYAVSLYAQGFATYRYTAILENMNGRYLIPILFPLAALAGIAISKLFGRLKAPKTLFAAAIVVMFLQGGGVLTFILNSDDTWYWNSKTVQRINHTATRVAKHVVVKKG